MMASDGPLITCLTRCKETKKKKYSLIPLISGKEISVGRGLDVSVQLLSKKRDNMVLLSRKHAIFKENDEGKWTITDNKSLNGVYLNDVKVKAESPFPIDEGDIVQIGAKPEGETDAEFVFKVTKTDQLTTEQAHQILTTLSPSNINRKRNSQSSLPTSQSEVLTEREQLAANKRKRCVDFTSNKVPKNNENNNLNIPSSSNVTNQRHKEGEPFHQKRSDLNEEEREILNAILCQKDKHSFQDILQMIQTKSLSPAEKSQEEELKLKLEEKERLLKAKEEEMMRVTQTLKAKAQEKENCLMEQLNQQKEQLLEEKNKMEQEMKELAKDLEAKAHEKESTLMEQLTQQREKLLAEKENVEKTLQENLAKQLAEKDENFHKEQERLTKELEERIKKKDEEMLAEIEAQKKALLDEKQTVEESLQSEVAKNVEQKEALEQERKRLTDVISKKEEEYKSMHEKLEEDQKAREEEEKLKIAKAKQEAFDNITDVLESELQCSICAELFIQATTLNCSHSFCEYCINLWLKRKQECPVCRAPITSHNRSIVLDNYIDKMVENLGEDVKTRRKEMLDERKKTQGDKPKVVDAPVMISDGEDDDDEVDVVHEVDHFSSDEVDSNSQSSEEGIPGAYYGGYGYCYNCGARGHWANGCPN